MDGLMMMMMMEDVHEGVVLASTPRQGDAQSVCRHLYTHAWIAAPRACTPLSPGQVAAWTAPTLTTWCSSTGPAIPASMCGGWAAQPGALEARVRCPSWSWGDRCVWCGCLLGSRPVVGMVGCVCNAPDGQFCTACQPTVCCAGFRGEGRAEQGAKGAASAPHPRVVIVALQIIVIPSQCMPMSHHQCYVSGARLGSWLATSGATSAKRCASVSCSLLWIRVYVVVCAT